MAILKPASFARDTGLTDRRSYLEYLKRANGSLRHNQEQELKKLIEDESNKSREGRS